MRQKALAKLGQEMAACVSPCSRVTGRGSGTGDIFPNWLSIWDEQNVSKGTSRSSPVGNLGRLCAGWG